MGQTTRVFTKALPIAVALCVCGAIVLVAQGQCEIAKLLALDGQEYDGFGGSVAVSGDVAIVGAASDDDLGNKSGSAYIYRFNPDTSEWVKEIKLLASDGAANHEFGRSVALSGDIAIVGAWGHSSVYVYRFHPPGAPRSGWIEQAVLLPSDPAGGGGFGYSVSISGDLIVIGAFGASDVCTGCGAAYVFRYDPDTSGWVEEAKLTASDATYVPEGYDLFGWSVSISRNVAIVGKPRNTFPFAWGPGAAYVYRYDGTGWPEEVKLLPSNSAIGDMAGWSVAMSGKVAIIGAIRGAGPAGSQGSAHVFRYDPDTSGWVEEATLLDSQGAFEDSFASSVAIEGDRAIIGARSDDDSGMTSGSAFIFGYDPESSGWIEQAKLLPSGGEAGDLLGWSAAIDGDLAMVGALGDDDSADGAGSAYVFDVAACVCPADLDDDGSVGILDLLALFAAWGTNPGGPPDFDDDGSVGITDLLTLLANWGPCP